MPDSSSDADDGKGTIVNNDSRAAAGEVAAAAAFEAAEEENLPSFPAWHHFVAGGVAGAGSRLVTAPLDLVRIRRQLAPPTLYPSESLWRSWLHIVEQEGGVAALYRGNWAAIYLWIGYSAVQFSLYKQARAVLEGGPVPLPASAVAFGAGAAAGVAATLATYPFDVCRTTFAARGTMIRTAPPAIPSPPQPVPFHSLMEPPLQCRYPPPPPPFTTTSALRPPTTLWDFAVQLHRQRGWKGFYAGAGPAVVQIVPYMGLNFAIYDAITTEAPRSVALSASAGSISGATSKLLVYPLDTVKRRLQAQAFFGDSGRPQYRGTLDCATRLWREEGLTAFYRGAVPSVLKSTLASALSFALYRSTTNALELWHSSRAGVAAY